MTAARPTDRDRAAGTAAPPACATDGEEAAMAADPARLALGHAVADAVIAAVDRLVAGRATEEEAA